MALILIVDDEPSLLLLTRIALEAVGHEVIEAANGALALEACTARVPDAVVTDVMMPMMDGRELIARLRSQPETEKVPIVVQTSVDNPPEEADAALRKPVDPTRLAQVVDELIQGRQ